MDNEKEIRRIDALQTNGWQSLEISKIIDGNADV